MNLQVVGCSHHQSNVAIRERLSFTEQQVRPFLDLFYHQFPKSEAVLLSTCNRTEFYAAAENPELIPSKQEMIKFLAQQRGLSIADINADLFAHSNQKAIEHLFNVAASLDSMVVGEAQILSQVKKAYQIAIESNDSIPLTHQVFQSAIRVARRVSNETDIHANRVSVPSVAIGVLAKQIFERLDNKKILIVGAGEMAEETLKYVVTGGGKDIRITNRTESKARELAKQFNGRVCEWTNLKEELATADLVVSTTGATEPIVTSEMFDHVEKVREQKPILILDLAIPRDFAADIGERLNVYLYTLDDLQKECELNRESRESEYPKAAKIITQETNAFFADVRRRSSGSTIAQLRQQADKAKNVELDRLMNRIEGVSEKQKKEIEQSFNRLVNKILHPPLKSLRDDTSNGSGSLLDALKKLFQLGD
ncbi:MAG: glutamyl-tRNA reductase [Mariniblastus sp.]|nr:glutamyl-tRNA reductase [Mariniblastus sp.]